MAQIPKQTAALVCPNCKHQFTISVQSVIDVGQDPAAKNRFLAGQVNVATCPRCGAGGLLNAPFVYHDPLKELLFAFTPATSNLSDAQQQRFIGSMVNAIMTTLPSDRRKGYLFQPRTFLSLDTMIDEIMIADGFSREQLEAQKRKFRLLERLLGATSDDVIQFIAQENRRDLDYEFFAMLQNILDHTQELGNVAETNRLRALRATLLEHSELTPSELLDRAETISPQELIQQLLKIQDETQQKELVAAIRPLLDYTFFQSLTTRMEEAEKAGDQPRAEQLLNLRTRLLAWIDEMDTEAQKIWQRKARLIEQVLRSNDWRAALEPHWQEIDSVFLTILGSNIRIAQEQGHEQAASTLRQLIDLAMIVAREHAPPEIQLLNRLLETESSEKRQRILEQNQTLLNAEFLRLIDSIAHDLAEDGRTKDLAFLQSLRGEVTQVMDR
ncbi:MAG: CpXC domain-containing protein [Chloroflexota bacterium]